MKELVKVIAVSLVDQPDEIVVTAKETENVDINRISTKGTSETSNKKEF